MLTLLQQQLQPQWAPYKWERQRTRQRRSHVNYAFATSALTWQTFYHLPRCASAVNRIGRKTSRRGSQTLKRIGGSLFEFLPFPQTFQKEKKCKSKNISGNTTSHFLPFACISRFSNAGKWRQERTSRTDQIWRCSKTQFFLNLSAMRRPQPNVILQLPITSSCYLAWTQIQQTTKLKTMGTGTKNS